MSTKKIIESMSASDDIDELWAKFTHYLKSEFGIASIFYGTNYSKIASINQGLSSSSWIKTNHTDRYFDIHPSLIDNDPDNYSCIRSITESFWHKKKDKNLSNIEKNAIDHANSVGLSIGVTLPIHAKGNGLGWSGIGLNFDGITPRELDNTWRLINSDVAKASYSFDLLLREKFITQMYPLNTKQIDILNLLSAGLGTKRVAASFGVTEKAINYHVVQASKILQTVNREHTLNKFTVLSIQGKCWILNDSQLLLK